MRAFTAILLTACATTSSPPQGGPRGLRANDHLEAARQHDEAARNADRWPIAGSSSSEAGPNVVWFRSWDATIEHERLATLHRSQAAALHAAYDDACGPNPGPEVSISPLQQHGVGGWNTSTGVIVYLAPTAGDAERLLAALRCHRAAMMLAPAGMDDCPLDLPGLQLDARGDRDGITVSIAVRDPKLVSELQRRAARELEFAAQLRAQPAR